MQVAVSPVALWLVHRLVQRRRKTVKRAAFAPPLHPSTSSKNTPDSAMM
jgi:hypothetical protein